MLNISYCSYHIANDLLRLIFFILALGYGSIVNKIGAEDYVDFKRSVRSQSGKIYLKFMLKIDGIVQAVDF